MEATLNTRAVKFEKTESYLLFKIKIFLLQPMLAGILGFIIVLTTLITTYFVTYKFFEIGYLTIGMTELLVSLLVGFVPLFIVTSPRKFADY